MIPSLQVIIFGGAPSSASGGGGTPFVGPGDVVSGATGWWGLRGYSAAYSTGSNPGVDLVDQAGANPITINILANGSLDVASISTWVAAHTVTTIKVTKLYDQTGSAHHLTQATLATMPVLTLSALGSLPGLTFNGNEMEITSFTPPNVLSMSSVAKRTGNTAGLNVMITAQGNPILGFWSTANTIGFNPSNGTLTLTAADNAFHAAQATANGTTATLYVDGATTSFASTSVTGGTGTYIGDRGVSGGLALAGVWMEAGIWPSVFSAGNASSMNSNQHSYWGF
jgi:hypothetical protein